LTRHIKKGSNRETKKQREKKSLKCEGRDREGEKKIVKLRNHPNNKAETDD
jgi:hypothetical protein